MRNNIRPLSAALAKIAADELNENPDDVKFYLDALRHWLTRQPHLKSRTQDQFLIGFLRGSKFSLEKSKEKIDAFYTCRGLLPELCRNRDVEDPRVYEVWRLGAVLHLPQPIAEDGPRVILVRAGELDFHRHTLTEYLRVGLMMAELCLYDDDNAIICGYIIVMDMTNVTPFHLFHFDPLFLKKIINFSNMAVPSRMKGFHLINMMPAFEVCFNMIKSAINEKLQKRIHFHGSDLSNLYKYVPKHCFPLEYGGKCDTIQDIVGFWENKFRKNKNFFIEEDNFGCNEKLREGKPVTTESMFGFDGSFTKLNVD